MAADGLELRARQIDSLNKLPPAAGDHHNEEQMGTIER